MTNNRLDMLYEATILEHSKYPKNKGTLEEYTHETQLLNPACGDIVTVQLLVEKAIILDIRFNGQGCAISMASASIMTDLIKGKSLEEAQELNDSFSVMVQGNEEKITVSLGEAEFLQGVSKFPTRIRCATLPWHALKESIEGKGRDQIG